MTNNGLFNDKLPIIMSGLMILAFWVSMLIQPLQKFYLGDPEAVKSAMQSVADQGKART